eukprot:s1134_g11.t1
MASWSLWEKERSHGWHPWTFLCILEAFLIPKKGISCAVPVESSNLQAKMIRQNENISPKVFNLLARQLTALQQEKLDGVQFVPNHEDPMDVQAIVEGPTQTPYEGGSYVVKIVIGAEFPLQPPRAVFLTKIFHPNISLNGDVCVNTLKRDWDPQNWSLAHVLQAGY